MFRDDCPNNVIRDLVVFMAQNIADSTYLFPWHFRSNFQQVIRYVAGRLGNDFKRALDSEFEEPVLLEVNECQTGSMTLDAV